MVIAPSDPQKLVLDPQDLLEVGHVALGPGHVFHQGIQKVKQGIAHTLDVVPSAQGVTLKGADGTKERRALKSKAIPFNMAIISIKI